MAQKPRKQTKMRTKGDPPLDETYVSPVADAPVVIVYKSKTKKGKKKGSSPAARRLEDIESRVSKAVHRVTKAVDRGVATYLVKRDKSARKRRDGALVDFCENVSVGTSEALANSSPVLTDVAKALNTRRLRKRIRKALRGIPVIG